MSSISERLEKQGIILPEPTPALASYLPYVREGCTLYISGQLPFEDGELRLTGKVGVDRNLESGQKAARLCAIQILAQVRAALNGDLELISRCLKITGYVASAPTFYDQPKVINGASDLLLSILGERGRHTRAAVGVACLPLNACVEIDALFTVQS